MNQAPFTSKRWRRVEYERLVEVGAFEGEPIELIGGQLVVAEPKGSPHAAGVDMTGDALRAALPPGWIVRVQNPLALDDESSPEPDVAVVRGHHADYRHAHPVRAALIVEVYRDPGTDLTAPFVWRFSSVERFRPPATLTLLELPQATVPVAALLP